MPERETQQHHKEDTPAVLAPDRSPDNVDWLKSEETRAAAERVYEIAQEKLDSGEALKAVSESGKVEPQGQPLPSPGPDAIPISAEDIARITRKVNRRLPKTYRGILGARPADPEEEARALAEYDPKEETVQ